MRLKTDHLHKCAILIYERVRYIMCWRKRRASAEETLLVALISGAILKAHRTLDGSKRHQLHHLDHLPDHLPVAVEEQTVRRLEQKQLIQSNMKFPAATYLLTEQGATLARELSGRQEAPLTVRRTPITLID